MGLPTVHDSKCAHINLSGITALVIPFPDFEVSYIYNFRSIILP